MIAHIDNNFIRIKFTFNPDILKKVKTLHLRHYIGGDMWECPLIFDNVALLSEWGFTLTPKLQSWFDKQKTTRIVTPITPHGLKRELREFQKEGVGWIEATNGRTIIGDQQGLGKTTEVLAWLQLHPEKRPVVIVCPANAKWTFYDEAGLIMTTGDLVHMISGEYGTESPELPEADIYIINYDILYTTTTCLMCKGKGKKTVNNKTAPCKACYGNGKTTHVRHDLLKALNFVPSIVILDECHYLQTSTTHRTLAVKKLCERVEHIIPMSGTPIKNRPSNFFPVLNLVRPDIFPSFWKYAHSFCGAKLTRFGWDFSGSSNMEKLNELLVKHLILLRRTKEDVLPQLPALVRTPVYLELAKNQEHAYNIASDDFLLWLELNDSIKLDAAKRAEALTRINYLKQMVVKFKLSKVIEWVDSFLQSGNHLILFAHHKFVIDQLYEKFKNVAVKVDGSTSPEERRDAETTFQQCRRCGLKKDKHIASDKCKSWIPNKKKLFIGSMAAKESLTLTAASDVAFIEFWDSPKDHEQAEERCYGRVGDLHGATAWYLVVRNTIEEDLLKSQEQKRKIIDSIIDGKTENEDGVEQLINNFKTRVVRWKERKDQ